MTVGPSGDQTDIVTPPPHPPADVEKAAAMLSEFTVLFHHLLPAGVEALVEERVVPASDARDALVKLAKELKVTYAFLCLRILLLISTNYGLRIILLASLSHALHSLTHSITHSLTHSFSITITIYRWMCWFADPMGMDRE